MLNQQTKTEMNQQPTQNYLPYANTRDDEINLADLWLVLVEKKWVIAITVAICILAAIVYLATTAKVYKTTALTLPPSPADVQALNTSELLSFTPETLYAEFLTHVGSVTLQREALDAILALDPKSNALSPEEKDQLFDSFSENITVTTPKKENPTAPVLATTLTIDHTNPALSQVFLNKVIDMALQATVATNFASLQRLIETRLTKIPQEIDRLTLSEKAKRENEIAKLEEEILMKKDEILQQILAIKNKLKAEKLSRIAELEERDQLNRKILQEKINALRKSAVIAREAEIVRLEEADRIERDTLLEVIRVLRDNAVNKRLDRIQQLRESANIAKTLGIIEPAPSVNLPTPNSPVPTLYAETKTPPNETALYWKGEKALRAEIQELQSRQSEDPFIMELRPLLDRLAQLETNETIEILKNRTNDDPFIEELPDLMQQLALLDTNAEIEILNARQNNDLHSAELLELNRQLELVDKSPRLARLYARQNDTAFAEGIPPLLTEQRKLETIKLQPHLVKAAIIDKQANTPASPIKPKKALTLALALVAGLIIGLFAAFFAHFISAQNKINASK